MLKSPKDYRKILTSVLKIIVVIEGKPMKFLLSNQIFQTMKNKLVLFRVFFCKHEKFLK
jgi:hypothetical protein